MIPMEWFNPASVALTLLLTTGSTVAVGAWWLSKQFNNSRNYLFDKLDLVQLAIVNKLEYHERHDDQRFSQMRDDIWQIRLRNASRDESVLPIIEEMKKVIKKND